MSITQPADDPAAAEQEPPARRTSTGKQLWLTIDNDRDDELRGVAQFTAEQAALQRAIAVVTACNAAGEAELAVMLLQQKATPEQAAVEIAAAQIIRQAATAAGLPAIGDQLIRQGLPSAIVKMMIRATQQQPAEFVAEACSTATPDGDGGDDPACG